MVQALGPQEQARIDAALAELESEGVDVDDLASLSAGLDAAYAAWTSGDEAHRPDHAAIVERYAIGVGAHLDRTTDLDWQVVTDVFGTDLSMTEGFKGSFVVVPAQPGGRPLDARRDQLDPRGHRPHRAPPHPPLTRRSPQAGRAGPVTVITGRCRTAVPTTPSDHSDR